MKAIYVSAAVAAMLALSGPGVAQTASETETETEAAAPAEAPDSLQIYFASGSAAVVGEQALVLDQAARLFREGSPLVMVVAGGADTVGAAETNLDLSIRRAQAVVDGLVDRGIPAGRLQVLGRGTSELAVDTPEGVDNPDNRVVEITWR